jgi:uncharacterized membrane protein
MMGSATEDQVQFKVKVEENMNDFFFLFRRLIFGFEVFTRMAAFYENMISHSLSLSLYLSLSILPPPSSILYKYKYNFRAPETINWQIFKGIQLVLAR